MQPHSIPAPFSLQAQSDHKPGQIAAAAQMQEQHAKRERELEALIVAQRERENDLKDQVQYVMAASQQEKATLEAKLSQTWDDLRQATLMPMLLLLLITI